MKSSRAALLQGILFLVAGFVLGGFLAYGALRARYDRIRGAELERFEAERNRMQAALAEASRKSLPRIPSGMVQANDAAPAFARLSPKEILQRLQTLRATGENSQAGLREAVYLLEELVHQGPVAIPEIRDFLERYVDVELDTVSISKAARGILPTDFVIPPSVRLGLFEVLSRIGTTDAEEVLASALARTGRGIEVACLSRLLDQFDPRTHRIAILSVARQLLSSNAPMNSISPLDRNHRDYLFSVLSRYGDTEFAATAQSQLVRPDNQLDVSALKYLQQTLGPAAVSIAAQTYGNAALTNSASREPLARLALHYAGASPEANTFYASAINDPTLTRSHRKNLIEDLNETGFADPKNLKPDDLPLIESRLALIEQLAPSAMDDANAAAFKEAYKDLINMRARLTPKQAASGR